ncbi:MAG: nuclease [Pseudomonadota bacterium]
MVDDISILWSPAGFNLPSLGARALVDVSDGDTPNIRMPIRMLSIDTPEVTAKSENGAKKIDVKFAELRQWILDGFAPVTSGFADYILPKLEGEPGTLQFTQGKDASAFHKAKVEERLRRPSGRRRNLFVRTAETKFDSFGRLLAYTAPSYSSKELKGMTRAERATFNLNMIESGHAAPFVLFPSIPGELDMPLFLKAAVTALDEKRGQYADDKQLPGYEYRMLEKLHRITKKIASGTTLSFKEKIAWRSRYAFDARDRVLYGPEDYMDIPPPYRIWLWPEDVQQAMGMLNLTPSAGLLR